jgi:hypothetical protein
MEVALRSSRTRTTVPSRISRAIGSSANAWAFHAPQSPFTLRYIRLTVPLPTPANRTRSAWRNGAYWRRYRWPRSARWEASVRRSPQSLAVPFRRFAVPGVQPSARHVNLSVPEGPISVPGYRAEGAAIPAAALATRASPAGCSAGNGVRLAANSLSWRGLPSGAQTPMIRGYHPGDRATLDSHLPSDGTLNRNR